MTIAGTPVLIGRVRGTALDGQGRLVAAVDGGPGYEAIVRQSAGGAPEILIETGDPLGPGLFTGALREPSVNAAGTVAFSATTNLGSELIATLVPGGTASVLFSVPLVGPPGTAPHTLDLAPPAINAAGVVGFLRGDPAAIRVQRVAGGVVATVATAGDPAPGGDTFSAINWVYPAVDAAGGVLFGATRSDGRTGLYRSDGLATRVAEEGDATGGGGELVGVGDWSITPLVASDGAVRFTAVDTFGAGLFASAGGVVTVDLRAGTPLDEPARFLQFDTSPTWFLPHLSAGPFMAADGGVVFDALVTGRGRGLFARAADGTVAPVALDGDAAPGGGHFDGAYFTFASMAPGGRVAFLGAAPDGGRGSTLQLFVGSAGGALERIVGGGDSIPGFVAPISSLLPPSSINASGDVVVPAFLSDGTWLLLVWDGAALGLFAATGDALPGGDTIASLRLGQPGALLPPSLDDTGTILFGAQIAGGTSALYRATLEGGPGSAFRVLGDGDLVQGGTLQPFRPQGLAVDRSGRLAFQAVPALSTAASTWSADVGPIPRLVKPPVDPNPPPPPPGLPPPVDQAFPRLAATAGAAWCMRIREARPAGRCSSRRRGFRPIPTRTTPMTRWRWSVRSSPRRTAGCSRDRSGSRGRVSDNRARRCGWAPTATASPSPSSRPAWVRKSWCSSICAPTARRSRPPGRTRRSSAPAPTAPWSLSTPAAPRIPTTTRSTSPGAARSGPPPARRRP